MMMIVNPQKAQWPDDQLHDLWVSALPIGFCELPQDHATERAARYYGSNDIEMKRAQYVALWAYLYFARN